MTRYTVVSDIHANYPALEAVLEGTETDGLICLGDIVGLNGYPRETIEALRERTTYCLRGNHDVAVLEYQEGHVNSAALSEFECETTHLPLTEEQIEWVNALPTYQEITDEGLLMAHAKPYPAQSSGYEFENGGVLPRDFTAAGARVPDWVDYLMLGHTHAQHVVDCKPFGNDVTVINPGSVGQPIEGPAEYAVVDTDDGSVWLREVEYDWERTAERIVDLNPPTTWW